MSNSRTIRPPKNHFSLSLSFLTHKHARTHTQTLTKLTLLHWRTLLKDWFYFFILLELFFSYLFFCQSIERKNIIFRSKKGSLDYVRLFQLRFWRLWGSNRFPFLKACKTVSNSSHYLSSFVCRSLSLSFFLSFFL